MAYTLRGKIARAHPYQLDTTLTVYGAGAEAEATGKAINAVKKIAEEHIANTANPHKVTKGQIGLGDVDNTPDAQKPVSVFQAEAIADAKKAGTDAQTAAENAQKSANNAQTAADEAKNLAETKAQEAEQNAKNYSDNKIEEVEQNVKNYSDNKHKYFTVTLTAEGWTGEAAPFTQTVEVEGILGTDRPHWGLVYSDSVAEGEDEPEAVAEEGGETEEGNPVLDLKLAEKEAFNMVDDLDTADGSVTFTCLEEKPALALTIQMEVNR